ncbi:hypothetical protein [Thioalkalivibrio sp. ALE19]|uniref:hypothetical protein n=1 Tax=Thioalkalivibrio sp. ALE19 TaxID=1266909 RepID=UPI000404A00D|nr:hypothetical protein [Thioalkalivibrio sp. ALE19]
MVRTRTAPIENPTRVRLVTPEDPGYRGMLRQTMQQKAPKQANRMPNPRPTHRLAEDFEWAVRDWLADQGVPLTDKRVALFRHGAYWDQRAGMLEIDAVEAPADRPPRFFEVKSGASAKSALTAGRGQANRRRTVLRHLNPQIAHCVIWVRPVPELKPPPSIGTTRDLRDLKLPVPSEPQKNPPPVLILEAGAMWERLRRAGRIRDESLWEGLQREARGLDDYEALERERREEQARLSVAGDGGESPLAQELRAAMQTGASNTNAPH